MKTLLILASDKINGFPQNYEFSQIENLLLPKMAVFSHHREAKFGIFKCTGQRRTSKATENSWKVREKCLNISPPTSALNVHDKDRNLHHEMKKLGMIWLWVGG